MTPQIQHTTRSVVRNVAYGAATWVVPIILALISTRTLVHHLGTENYGIYVLILGFIGYSFSFGIGRALTKYIAEFRASGEDEKIREVVSATLIIAGIVGLVGAGSIILFSGSLVDKALMIGPDSRDQTLYAFYLTAPIIFVAIFNQAFGSALQAVHRFDVYSKIFNAASIVQISGTIVLAVLGFGLIALLLWNLASVTASAIVTFFLVRRYISEFGFDFKLQSDSFWLVFRFSVGIVGYNIVANALLLFERSWLTRELGPENVSYYVIAFTPGLHLHGFVGTLVLMLAPLASEFGTRRDDLLVMYKQATRLITAFVFFAVTMLVVESRTFLTVWVGEQFADKASVILVVLTLSFGIIAILSVSWQMKEGLGVPKFNFAASSVALAAGVPAMMYFTEHYGAVGMAIGRLVAFSILIFSIVHFEVWLFERVLVRFWSLLLLRSVFCSLLTAAVLAAIHLAVPQPIGWASLILSGMSGALFFGACAWVVGLIAPEEKTLLKQALAPLS